MKLFYITVLLYFFVASATAGEHMELHKHPTDPSKCVVHDKVLSADEIAQGSNGCYQMICLGEGYVKFQTCGAQVVGRDYKLGEPLNPTANYPDCCERTVIPVSQ